MAEDSDRCGHPDCQGSLCCAEPDCIALHPNACSADHSQQGWLCPKHEKLSLKDAVKVIGETMLIEFAQALRKDPKLLADTNRSLAPHGLEIVLRTPTGVCQYCKKKLEPEYNTCARCADERGP